MTGNSEAGFIAGASGSLLARRLAVSLPIYYGWVILGVVFCACLARSGPAAATLSMFVKPMTEEFGWSRTAFAGAVSVGGILAALISPMIGSYLDRSGPRLVLGIAVLATGLTLMSLAFINSIVAFYLFYCVARMCWAGPFDLGINGALNNWFIERRAFVASLSSFTQTMGIIMMPLIGFALIEGRGWRTAWLVIGALVLLVGFLPGWLLMIRRPEDVGLVPDGPLKPAPATDGNAPAGGGAGAASAAPPVPEPSFTRAEALRTQAFWLLALFTALVWPIQAGMSLHQPAHLMERGLTPGSAAMSVSIFTAASALTGLSYGFLLRRIGVKVALVATGCLLSLSALVMTSVTSLSGALVSAILFGMGMGGMHVTLPVAWADYFGRRSFGAIRGVALSIQVAAQAAGPLLSGILRDLTGTYTASLMCFATLGALGALAALATRAPDPKS